MMYDVIIFSCFVMATLTIGFLAARGVHSLKDFGLSKGSFGSFALICTMVASFLGGGTVIGTLEKSYLHGVGYFIGILGFPLQLILTALIIVPCMKRFSYALTVGDIVREAYGKHAQIFIGLVWMFFCIGILTVQMGAMGRSLSVFLALDTTTCIIISALIVISYCFLGGIRAVIATDVFQCIILSVALMVTFVLSLTKAGGLSHVIEHLPTLHLSPTGHLSLWDITALFITFVLGDALIPPMIQRLLMARDTRQSFRITLISGILLIPACMIASGLGLITMTLNPDLDSTKILPYLFNQVLPATFTAIATAGMLSIVMSTADSYLNSTCVMLVNDVIEPIYKRPLSEKKRMYFVRFATIFLGSIAVYFAVSVESLLDVLIFTFKFWGPIAVVPIGAAILGWSVPRWGFYTSVILSLGFMFLWEACPSNKLISIGGMIPAIVVSALTCMVSNRIFIRNKHAKPSHSDG